MISLAVFAKTPALSPVKTRLAVDIGTEQAQAFYQHSLACTAAMLDKLKDKNTNIDVVWAVAEEQHKKDNLWQQTNTLWTGPGDLGQRLHQVYSRLKKQADIVIIIGSDCPLLTAESIQNAITLLQEGEDNIVIGPADDGGFYLFASNQAITETTWVNTTYSHATTLEQLVKNLNEPVTLLDFSYDIDTLVELKQLKQQLDNKPKHHFGSKERQLYQWLEIQSF
ncbi:MAG: glycosyltransferase [Pseudomonadales bacterium]|nr:glycosyltransferase [Pseudomonadales bacterium]